MNNELQEFMEGQSRNAWLSVGKAHVYLCKSWRFHGQARTLDVANIDVPYQHRGNGEFTRALAEIVGAARAFGYQVVYVENVINPVLMTYFRKMLNWKEVAGWDGSVPSFFLDL